MGHVLVIEDEPDVREMMETYLRMMGYSTSVAANGREGLELLAKRKPNVVVLDLMMPVMSGWQFREAQLADPALAEIPVVCVSAVADRTTVSDQLGAPCLSKPVNLDELSRLLRQVCSGQH